MLKITNFQGSVKGIFQGLLLCVIAKIVGVDQEKFFFSKIGQVGR